LPSGRLLESPMLQDVAVHPIRPDVVLLDRLESHPPDISAIRETAVRLVSADRLSDAFNLVADALEKAQDSQELLALIALICEASFNWSGAAAYLERLIRIQGEHAPAETLSHWVRVLRCQGHLDQALDVASRSLQIYPDHPMLASEFETLNSIRAVQTKKVGA
jgi:tetratricopeptide (TPR) repeat protein